MDKKQDISRDEFKKLLKPNAPLIGIDYGAVRIGVAVSDNRRVLASPFKIIGKISELDAIVEERHPCGFVVGMPYTPDGKEGKTAEQVRLFTNRLIEKFGLPVYFWDERNSSVHVEEKLHSELKISHKKIKEKLDAVVAASLLQDVLDTL